MAGFPNVPITELFHLKQGTYLAKDEMAETQSDDFPHPVYGANGVIGYSPKKMYSQRTTLISCRGANCGVVHYTVPNVWISNNSIACVPKAELDPTFYYYVCHSTDFGGVTTGSAQPQITITNLSSKQLIRPPLPIQRRIASLLFAYDNLIENNTRRIQILEQQAQALYREWFVEFRFPGHAKSKLVGSPLGQIPQGWEIVQVEDIVERVSVGMKYDIKTVTPEGRVPVLDQGKSGVIGYHDDEPGLVASEDKPIIVFANHTCYQRLIQFPFSAIQNVLPFLPHPERSRDIYWLHWATNGLVKFNDYKGHWPEFASKQLLLPPVELCSAFGSAVKPMVRLSYKLTLKNINLRRTRDLLLPKLISGALDVSKLEIETA